jgi:hypothetical protein
VLAFEVRLDLVVTGIKRGAVFCLARIKTGLHFAEARVEHAFYFAGKLLGGLLIAHGIILFGSGVRR